MLFTVATEEQREGVAWTQLVTRETVRVFCDFQHFYTTYSIHDELTWAKQVCLKSCFPLQFGAVSLLKV